jgi:hypothetical protein
MSKSYKVNREDEAAKINAKRRRAERRAAHQAAHIALVDPRVDVQDEIEYRTGKTKRGKRNDS